MGVSAAPAAPRKGLAAVPLSHRSPALLLALTLAGCGADLPPVGGPTPELAESAIVGGRREAGYPAVGALAIDYARQWGSFCTATLIAESWVLTAAHCLDDPDVTARMTSFFVGADARDPDNGAVYEADEFFIHPSYREESYGFDVGLVHLSQQVVDVEPYPLNRDLLDDDLVGESPTYVGFGINDGVRETGSGLKRRGTTPIDRIMPSAFTVRSVGTLRCSGDSGGPALLELDGELRVIGVVSTADETCSEGGVDTRVDMHGAWIDGILGGGNGRVQACDLLGGDCPGGSACSFADEDGLLACLPSEDVGVGGACDSAPEAPLANLRCTDGTICLSESAERPGSGACRQLCYEDAECEGTDTCYTPVFRDDPDLGACLDMPAECDISGGDCPGGEACFFYMSGTYCFPSDGIPLGEACDPDTRHWADSKPCGDGLICLQAGVAGDEGECYALCDDDADCGGEDACRIPIFNDLEGIGRCGCRDDDADGRCVPEDCDDDDRRIYPGARERCDNGLDDDCDGETDEECFCTDRDGDGICADDDCDDLSGSVYPGADETCDNQLDDDCDGATDEGCEGEGEGPAEGEGEGADEGEGEGPAEGEGEGSAEGEGEGSAEGEGEGGDPPGSGGGVGGRSSSSGCVTAPTGSPGWVALLAARR